MIFPHHTGTSALTIYISNIQGQKKYSAVMYYEDSQDLEDDQVTFLFLSPRPHHCQDLYVEDDQVTFLCPFPHQCQQQAAQEIEDSASRLFAH